MRSIELNTRNVAIVLVAILLFHAINNAVWLYKDTRPPAWDQSWHLMISLSIYDKIFKGTSPEDIEARYPIFEFARHYYPPLFHSAATPFYLIFGKNPDVGVFSNILFLGVLIFSVFGIGERLFNRKVGLLAAFMVATFPIIFGLSKEYLIDLSLAAMVSLALYTLLMTDYFKSTKYSYIFGVVVGLGLLSKWTFILFVVGPLVHIFFRMDEDFLLKNFVIPLIIGCLIASSWYIAEKENVLRNLKTFSGKGVSSNEISGLNWENISYYFLNLKEQISPIYFAVFILGLVFFYRCREKSIIILHFMIPYLLLTVISHKDIRFFTPVLPIVAVVSANGLLSLPIKRLRVSVVVIVLLLGVAQFFYLSYSLPILKTRLFLNPGTSYTGSPKNENWKIEEILDYINNTENGRGQYIQILSEISEFNDVNFPYHSYLHNYPMKIVGAGSSPMDKNYVITKDKNLGKTWRSGQVEYSLRTLNGNKEKFTLAKKFSLPDGSNALVYKRV